jgi:hypothetical protein
MLDSSLLPPFVLLSMLLHLVVLLVFGTAPGPRARGEAIVAGRGSTSRCVVYRRNRERI